MGRAAGCCLRPVRFSDWLRVLGLHMTKAAALIADRDWPCNLALYCAWLAAGTHSATLQGVVMQASGIVALCGVQPAAA